MDEQEAKPDLTSSPSPGGRSGLRACNRAGVQPGGPRERGFRGGAWAPRRTPGRGPYAAQPLWNSTACTPFSVQASWPLGTEYESPAFASILVPSFRTTVMSPETTYPMWEAMHQSPPTMGLMHSDHLFFFFQSGQSSALPGAAAACSHFHPGSQQIFIVLPEPSSPETM